MDTVSESKETSNETQAVTADHFDVVTAAMAAKKAANEANSAAYKAATERLDEVAKEIRDEQQAVNERNDALYETREAVRGAYNAASQRIEREYRVAVYGEDHVAREEAEKAESRRSRNW